jgi:hypothetical protein
MKYYSKINLNLIENILMFWFKYKATLFHLSQIFSEFQALK